MRATAALPLHITNKTTTTTPAQKYTVHDNESFLYDVSRINVKDHSLDISFEEWRDYLLFHPSADLADIIASWRHNTVSEPQPLDAGAWAHPWDAPLHSSLHYAIYLFYVLVGPSHHP